MEIIAVFRSSNATRLSELHYGVIALIAGAGANTLEVQEIWGSGGGVGGLRPPSYFHYTLHFIMGLIHPEFMPLGDIRDYALNSAPNEMDFDCGGVR